MSAEPPKPQKNKRWYDREPLVKQSIELLATFPDHVLTALAEGVNTVIEREYKVQELLRAFRSLGQEKVLALYKSKKKLRTLDQNPAMHQTVNYLYIIADESKNQIAQQVLDLVSIVYDYLQLCKKSDVTPSIQNIVRIRDEYVSQDIYAARHVLDIIRQEIAQLLISQRQGTITPPPPPPEPKRQMKLSDDEQGMRVNFNLNQ